MWGILAAGPGGAGVRDRGKNCGQLSYDEARVRSAGEPDTGGAWPDFRDEEKLRTERRKEKRVLQVNTEFMAAAASSHLHMARRRQTNYCPIFPMLPSPPQWPQTGSPPLFQMWQHSTTPLTRTKLPAPTSVFILLVTKRQMTDPITPQWWADCVHIVISALSPFIVIHLDISSRHHYRPVAFDVTASLLQSSVSNQLRSGDCHKLIALFEMSHNCIGFEFPQQQTRTFRRTEQNKG